MAGSATGAERVAGPTSRQRNRSALLSHHNGATLTSVLGSLRTRHGGAVVGCTHPHLADWNRPPTRGVRIGRHATAWLQADPARLLGDPRPAWGCSNCFHGAAHKQPNTADKLCPAPFGAANEASGRRGRALPPGSACGPLPPRQATVILAGRALHVPVAPVPDGAPRTTAVGGETR
jgi:hypothetical protein